MCVQDLQQMPCTGWHPRHLPVLLLLLLLLLWNLMC